MDALETLIREALAEHAHEAPPPDRLVVPPRSADRGRRRWPHVLLAAAAVAAVAIGVVVLRGGSSGNPPAAPTPIPTFAPIPPGMNEVSYHGITLQIPDNLPITSTARCQQRGVYTVDPHTRVANCADIPVVPPVKPTVTLMPYQLWVDRTELVPSQTATFRTVDLRKPGVHIEVAAPSAAQVNAIIKSIRITPVDRNGCRAKPLTLSNAPEGELLPGTPVAASECTYTTESRPSRSVFLLRSLPVDPNRLSRLVAAIRKLPAESGHGSELPGIVRYQFAYADGSVRTIDLTRGADPTVTDGQHIAHDPDNSIVGAFD